MSSKFNNHATSYNEQAFLMWKKFYHFGSAALQDPGQAKIGNKFEGVKIPIKVVKGRYEPTDVVSQLVKNKKIDVYKNFLNLETYKISSLVPQIKLYKIQNKKYVPFYFPTSTESSSIKSLLSGFGGGASGVGVKSFNVNFVGSDLFTSDKNINCSLSIFVENLDLIFKDPPTGHARLADLFTISNRPANSVKEGESKAVDIDQVYEPSNFEIVAVMGYSGPASKEIFTSDEMAAIENTHITLRMTLTDHSINVNQDGTASIDISYIGRIAGLLNDSKYDVMSSPLHLFEYTKVKSHINAKKKAASPGNPKGKKAASEARTLRQVTLLQFQKIMTYLVENKNDKRVYHYEISDLDLNLFRRQQEEWEDESIDEENKTKKAPKDKKDKRSEAQGRGRMKKGKAPSGSIGTRDCPEKNTSMKSISINYFYLGDMLEALFKVLIKKIKDTETGIKQIPKREKALKIRMQKYITSAKKELETFMLILTDIPLRISNKNIQKVNLADLPVSLSLWSRFVFEEVTQTGVSKYSLERFLKGLVNNLIPNLLAGHSFKDAKFLHSSTSIKALSLTGGNIKKKDVRVTIKDLPSFLMRIPSKNLKDETDYIVIYPNIDKTSEASKKGDLNKDKDNGIYHFYLAKDRGMVKNISFSRFDVPGKKESLMVNSVSLYDELRMPYHASIDMVGNNLFFPGSIIYINTSNMGFGDPRNRRSPAARLGLGGYYQVLSVSTSFDLTQISTNLKTSYLSWADDALSLFSEMRTEGHVSDATKVGKAEVNPSSGNSADAQGPRPDIARSTAVGDDLGFIFSDENLSKEEKLAIRNLIVHGEESHSYRRSSQDLPENTELTSVKNDKSKKEFVIRLARGEDIYMIERKGRSSSIKKKLD